MKKYNLANIVLFILFFVGLIITLLIVYQNITLPFAHSFVIGFIIYLIAYVTYLIMAAMKNIGKLHKDEVRKRIVKFIILFVLLGTINYLLNFIFQPAKNDHYGFLFTALGCSLGLTFFDLALLRKKRI
ncbi:hypothetical protein [Bacillus sp. FJAT-50079]|uniref:hypothetical protein n=1 Tax=Bacillus sp. FJAT-50079 TaxID=2833577 RepID=UPI001BC8F663|nr:hypothetical protein [Bacillus sp. FJAT-50079]MBS4207390.1 hypothetical protein [Bacillus sp. FJAT-50079]